MSEENTTQNPGLILPDDAAAADRVAGTDRLLSFDAAGNPVTVTASQLREYTAAGLATTEAMNAALAGKAALVPFSLTEQLVPGEFWDGKQVYQRTFKGTLPTTATEGTWLCPLTPGTLVDIVQVWGWVQQGNWDDPHMVPNSMVDVLSKGLYGACIIYNQALAGKSFNLTIKYTKA